MDQEGMYATSEKDEHGVARPQERKNARTCPGSWNYGEGNAGAHPGLKHQPDAGCDQTVAHSVLLGHELSCSLPCPEPGGTRNLEWVIRWPGRSLLPNHNFLWQVDLIPSADPTVCAGTLDLGHDGGVLTYLSAGIVADTLCAIATIVRADTLREIRNAKFVGVMIDESTDCSVISQLLIYYRLVSHTGEVRVVFAGQSS